MRRIVSFLAALLFASVAHAQTYPAPIFSGVTLNGKGALSIGNQSYSAGGNMKQDWLWSDGVFDVKTLGGYWPTSTYAWQVANKTFTSSSVSGQGTLYSPLANGPLSTRLTVANNNGATADVVASLNWCQITGNSGGTCFGGNDVAFLPTGKSGKLVGREIDIEFAAGSTDAGGSIGMPINVFSIASEATAIQLGGVGGGSWANGIVSRGVRGAHYSPGNSDATTSASFIDTRNGTFSNTAIVLGTGASQGINFGGSSFGASPFMYSDSSGNLTTNMGAGGFLVIQKPNGSQAFTLNQFGEMNAPNGGAYKISGATVIDASGAHVLTKKTVANLPTCSSGLEGWLFAVIDANSATFNATLAGGGSNHVMAYCNGTSWTVH